MQESGVDISNQTSNTLDEFDNIKMDYIFTVCSDAHDNCPYYPHGKTIHVGFEDPPRLTEQMQDEEEILSVYRRVRDEIKSFVETIEKHL